MDLALKNLQRFIYHNFNSKVPSRKLFKLDELDMQDTAGEAGTNS